MSDTKECCICYEATEHLTPCKHLVYESCFPRLSTCPMCRTPLEEDSSKEEEDSDFDIDEANQGMFEAALNGHIEIVRQMLAQGANNFNWVMHIATIRGDEHIARLMLGHDATDYDWIMAEAAISGHENIVRLLMNRGAINFNLALRQAALAGHENIVRLMLD